MLKTNRDMGIVNPMQFLSRVKGEAALGGQYEIYGMVAKDYVTVIGRGFSILFYKVNNRDVTPVLTTETKRQFTYALLQPLEIRLDGDNKQQEEVMFKVTDKDGKQIYPRDRVEYCRGGMDIETGTILLLLNEETVEIQPDKEGAPFTLPSEETKVVHSLIGDIQSLQNNEELQTILRQAEERYTLEVSKKRTKKSPAKKKPNPFA